MWEQNSYSLEQLASALHNERLQESQMEKASIRPERRAFLNRFVVSFMRLFGQVAVAQPALCCD
jgi:hypothetical protein